MRIYASSSGKIFSYKSMKQCLSLKVSLIGVDLQKIKETFIYLLNKKIYLDLRKFYWKQTTKTILVTICNLIVNGSTILTDKHKISKKLQNLSIYSSLRIT